MKRKNFLISIPLTGLVIGMSNIFSEANLASLSKNKSVGEISTLNKVKMAMFTMQHAI